jgi:nucleotide-binding universal stress UspA family protein
MAARDHLEHIRKIAADQNVKCKVVVRRAEANPYRAIIEEDKRWKADLIVMGRRGHKGFKKVMMGSVTAKIIATSRCNVLIVPRHAVMKAEHVLLATDGSKCSKAAEQEAISLCMSCHHLKSFTALSVIPAAAKLAEAERILNSVKQAAAGRGISAETISARGRPDEAIVETAHRLGIDIIIMGTHGRRGMEKLLKGSVSERVVSLSPCAVLIVKI